MSCSVEMLNNPESMSRIEKFLPGLFSVAFFLVLLIFLQTSREFLFYAREQQQLFIYSWHFFQDRYFEIGGFASLFSLFLVQFFSVPCFGSAVTAALCSLSAFLLWRALRKNEPSAWLFPLCLFPAIFQIHAVNDFYLDYSCLTGFLLAIAFLSAYQSFAYRLGSPARIISCVIATVASYLLLGPVSVIFPLGVVVLDFIGKRPKAYLQLFSLLGLVVTAIVLLKLGKIETFFKGLSCDFYYEPLLNGRIVYNASVICVPVVIMVVFLLRRLSVKSLSVNVIASCAVVLVLCVTAVTLSKHENKDIYKALRLQHDVITSDWDDILDFRGATDSRNYFFMNFVNLALSHENLLLENLFRYRQGSSSSLLYDAAGEAFNPQITILRANVYYWLGCVGSAQNQAFDSFVSSKHGNPSMLQMLVKTNLIFGSYDVAEKYIKILEKTWAYRRWASSQRRFLHDEAAIDSDPELGGKRRDLPDGDAFALIDGIYSNLLRIVEKNPGNAAARDYAAACMLMSRSKDAIIDFLNRFQVQDLFGTLPSLVQQAVVVAYENDLEYCRSLGVSDKTVGEYKEFKNRYKEARMRNQDLRSALKSRYRDTFWYYYIFGDN